MQHGGDCPSSKNFAQKIARVDIKAEISGHMTVLVSGTPYGW